MGSCCSCCGGDDKKEKENKERTQRLLQEEEEEKKRKENNIKISAEDLAKNRPAGSHRDRIIALFAKYEKENLPLIDPWMQKLAGPRRAEYYIKEFCLKHDCIEPKSKQEALKECLTRHYMEKEEEEKNAKNSKKDKDKDKKNQRSKSPASNSAKEEGKDSLESSSKLDSKKTSATNSRSATPSTTTNQNKNSSSSPPKDISKASSAVLKKVDETMKKFSVIKPGEEGPFFEEIFGPGDKQRMEEEQNDLNLIPSSSFAAGEALMKDAQDILKRIEEEERLEKEKNKKKQKREKRACTCDEEMKDRIMAMMIEHCPERLDDLVEEEHYYDSETGAELLYSLIEEFGEEPESKQAAITACYRRLLEEHDPVRLKSLPTMVAAAMAASKVKISKKKKKALTKSQNRGQQQGEQECEEEDDEEEVEVNGSQDAVAKVLRAYGVSKPKRRSDNNNAFSSPSSTVTSPHHEPAFTIPGIHSSASSTYYDPTFAASSPSTSSFLSFHQQQRKRAPPEQIRSNGFIPPYAMSMDGEVQKDFSAVPIPNHHQLISNYEKARLMVDSLSPENRDVGVKLQQNSKSNNDNRKMIEEMMEEFMPPPPASSSQEQENTNHQNSNKHTHVFIEMKEVEEKIQRDRAQKKKLFDVTSDNENDIDSDMEDLMFNYGDEEDEKNVSDDDEKGNHKKLKPLSTSRSNIFGAPNTKTARHNKNIVLPDISPSAPTILHNNINNEQHHHDSAVTTKKSEQEKTPSRTEKDVSNENKMIEESVSPIQRSETPPPPPPKQPEEKTKDADVAPPPPPPSSSNTKPVVNYDDFDIDL